MTAQKKDMSPAKAWAIVAALPTAYALSAMNRPIGVTLATGIGVGVIYGGYKLVTEPKETVQAARGFIADTIIPAFSTAFSGAKKKAAEIDEKLDKNFGGPKGPGA